MIFNFKARDAGGKTIAGKIDAISDDSAVQILQKKGLIPLKLEKEKNLPDALKSLQKMWEGVSQKELMVFFREFATLIEAKVPVVTSLRAVGDQSENTYMKTVVKEVADSVEDGMPLSESMAKFPDTFSQLTISMMKSGEVSGSLQNSVDFIADNIEKNYRLSSKIKSALFYPAFVMIVAGGVAFITVSFILPKLTGLIKDLGVEIPWYTQIIIYLSDFMKAYWWAVLIVILGAAGGLVYYIKSEAGRRDWDRIKLNIPIVGRLFGYIYLARFCSNFAVLLDSGIPIVRSLFVVSEVVGNTAFQGVILRAADEVKTGGNISTVFERSVLFPPIVTRIVKIGEETGKMSQVLKSASSFYEQEVDNMAKNMSSLIEPIMIVFLGIGVAILVFSILLPVYSVADKL